MAKTPFIIAIDGPSAGGKGTIAKKLAEHYGLPHLDTGLLYRAVGMAVIDACGDPADEAAAVKAAQALNPAALKDTEILRSDVASVAASKVAAIPAVRTALLKFQKDFVTNPPRKVEEGLWGAVVDGRDIGTVIAPKAAVKIFVTASPEVRAERRFKELQKKGIASTYQEVMADMQARDRRDTERKVAPSKAADDAVILKTNNLNVDEAFQAALRIVKPHL